MQTYTFAEDSNVYLNIGKQLRHFIFQKTTKIGNIIRRLKIYHTQLSRDDQSKVFKQNSFYDDCIVELVQL